MIKLIPNSSDDKLSEKLLKIFEKIIEDQQDSVRMHGIECAVSFSR